MNGWLRIAALFGHYDCRVFLTNHAYVDVGRGSLPCTEKIDPFPADFVGSLGSIGQFCEAAESSILMVAGEHRNELPVNLSFGGASVLRNASGPVDQYVKPLQPLSIGNGVVISTRAIVLPGCQIGDGAVLGASTLVTKAVAAFSVVVGTPACLLKMRMSDDEQRRVATVRWWDFDTRYMIENLPRLQQLAVDVDTSHRYRVPSPKFILSVRPKSPRESEIGVHGILDGERIIPFSDAPPRVKRYIESTFGPGPYVPDLDVWS